MLQTGLLWKHRAMHYCASCGNKMTRVKYKFSRGHHWV